MTSPPNPLDQLLRLKTSSPEFDDKVSNILQGEAYRTWVKHINGNDVVKFVEFLDRALDVLDPSGPGFRRCLRQLRNICGARMTLPKSYTSASQFLAVGDRPVASGGSGDVYEGTLNRSKVCVKRVRMYLTKGPEEATKTLYQEAIMWKRLEHKNIVPLLGMTTNPLQLISEWIPGGNLTEYIVQHPNANRRDLARDIAEGLYYLHSCNVVHGDLKGPNILVDGAGRARITDFGLATVTQNVDSVRSVGEGEEPAHTPRWTAPEILGGKGSHSKEADVFSFAMVMIEVFTGAVPFNHGPSAAAIVRIMNGERPPRPAHQQLTNDLWKIIQQCWDQEPHSRPEVSNILSVLGITNLPPINVQPHIAGSSWVSATSSPTPQISSQRSDHSNPNVPVNHVGLTVHESQRTDLHGISREPSRVPSSWADYHHPGEQRDNSNGNALPIQRKNTAASEISPVLKDPGAPGQMEPSQPYGRISGAAGKSHTDLQNTLASKNRSRRDFSGNGSHDDDEGRYWVEGRRNNRGTSSSALNLVDGHKRGDISRNPSRTDLLKNPSRDHLAQYSQSKTDLLNTGKSASHVDTGGGPPSRRPSKKDTPGMNSYATRNASRRELPATHGYNETHQGQVGYSHTGEAGMSRTNLQNTLGDRNRSRKDVRGQGPRLDVNHGDNGERSYSSGGRQDTRGASRSALNLVDGYGKGSRSQNPSRADLLRNASQDHPGQHGSDLHNLGKNTSHPDRVNPGGGHLPRQLSRNESSGVNGNPIGNAPNHDLASRTKPPDRGRPKASGAVAVPEAAPIVVEQPDEPIKKKGFCCF